MKLSSRSLGLVFWVEAPAIYALFMLASYGIFLVLKSYGIESGVRNGVHLGFMGAGTLVASAYIWLVAKNTSTLVFTVLARCCALGYVGLFIALFWLTSEAPA